MLDPTKLDDGVHEYHTAEFMEGEQRLVNRDDAVVELVMIGGRPAWRGGQLTEAFGRERLGR